MSLCQIFCSAAVGGTSDVGVANTEAVANTDGVPAATCATGDAAAMPGVASSIAAAGGAAEAAPAEKPKEEEPEEDVDMGDLFGGGDDDY